MQTLVKAYGPPSPVPSQSGLFYYKFDIRQNKCVLNRCDHYLGVFGLTAMIILIPTLQLEIEIYYEDRSAVTVNVPALPMTCQRRDISCIQAALLSRLIKYCWSNIRGIYRLLSVLAAYFHESTLYENNTFNLH